MDIHILIIGYISGALTTFASIPQIVKVFRSSSTQDLSYVSLSMSASGVCMWTIYGMLLKQLPMIIFDSLSLISFITLICLKVYMENFKKVKYTELASNQEDEPV